ncbi:DUF2771 domain-containing protein [Corynebacterium glyciniphilum]|uniref:DUF2771 domain-containing protein n=1 Tax=Corynebacterium glyciniphilum TaxID=1404244 RepID=UPI002652B88B|nr:DUF2771 domain-containing protein [Corynebacterium glyciniphilum]MDN5684439.1 DUF2771 domain-containing protein [Corynebacterium glyciniphilum]
MSTEKQTKKQRRRAAQRKQYITFGAIVLLVVVVAAAVLGYQYWSDNRPAADPQDLRVTVTDASGDEQEYAPYSVCQRFTGDCDEGEPSTIEVGPDDEVTLSLPEEVTSQDWSLLQIFDDQAANMENTWAAGEKSEVTVRGSAETDDGDARLSVVEVHALILGEEDGEEVPYGVVWAFNTGVEPDPAADPSTGPGSDSGE